MDQLRLVPPHIQLLTEQILHWLAQVYQLLQQQVAAVAVAVAVVQFTLPVVFLADQAAALVMFLV